jgi:hypothetical protein
MLRQVNSSSFPVSSISLSFFHVVLCHSMVFLILYPYGYPWPRKVPCTETISSFSDFDNHCLLPPFLKFVHDEHRFASIFFFCCRPWWAFFLKHGMTNIDSPLFSFSAVGLDGPFYYSRLILQTKRLKLNKYSRTIADGRRK